MREITIGFLKSVKNAAVSAARGVAAAISGETAKRIAFERRLGAIAGLRAGNSGKTTLIDGTFDNEGYFFRLTLLLKALGVSTGDCVGILGRYKAQACRRVISTLGVSNFEECTWQKAKAQAESATNELLRQWRTPEDVLASVLPDDLPSSILYDYLLKRQKAAVVDVRHPSIRADLVAFMGEIACASEIVRRLRPEFVILSHTITPVGAALAWAALAQNSTVLLAFGNYGTSRYCRITEKAEFFNSVDCADPASVAALPVDRREMLRAIGRAYLEMRFSGKSADVGGNYAFSAKNNASFDPYHTYGWNRDLPIVCVFASNWFDYPHGFGMKNFRDFADWINVTVEAISENRNINWLIRGHPCDAYYKGIGISDVLKEPLPPHVRICDPGVSGKSVMATVAAAVTFHGTVGVEYGACGKEVLVADVGWYHRFSFCAWPSTRDTYAGYLRNATAPGRLFGSTPLTAADRESAEILAALYFCVPEWQVDFCLPDDSLRAQAIPEIMRICRKPEEFVDLEISSILSWLNSESPRYHTFKMINAGRPCLPSSS
jgi:hypothetical protein